VEQIKATVQKTSFEAELFLNQMKMTSVGHVSHKRHTLGFLLELCNTLVSVCKNKIKKKYTLRCIASVTILIIIVKENRLVNFKIFFSAHSETV
jgi:hypothetical protein